MRAAFAFESRATAVVNNSCRGKTFHHGETGMAPSARNRAGLLTLPELGFRFFANISTPSRQSRLRSEMSMEFEYRRLAAACLDLAKRTAVLADKTRLLLIAEAWFDLADRVTRNGRNAEGGDRADYPLVVERYAEAETEGRKR